jgi:3-methyladenine DNA glycosylase AlkD
MEAVLDALTTAFERHRDPDAAVAMAAYMRDQFAFAGIQTPTRRALAREVLAGREPPSERELVRVARACWKRPEREYQYFACDYLVKYAKRCSPRLLGDLRWLVTHKSWWDTVDALAKTVGDLVRTHDVLRADMDQWVDDDNFWIARVAIIHQLGFKGATDADRLFGYCTRRAADTEFFIRKAIGWALREYSKTDPDAVRTYVAAHPELSPLSKKEALRRIT